MPPVANLPPVSMTPVANCRRYQQHQRQICHQYQRHRWQIFPPVSLVLLTLVANLPPVSTIPAANCRRCQWRQWQIATGINDTDGKFATGVVDNGGKYREQYQAADTLKWTWRQKFIYMLTLLPKGAQAKLLKFFCLKIFSICHRCRWHRWCTLSREYLREFSKKIWNGRNGLLRCFGETDSWKNQKSKISWHCSFKYYILAARGHSYVALLKKKFSLICWAVDLQSFWYSQCAQNFNHSRLK